MAVIPGRPPHCSSVTSVYLVVAIRFLAKNILRAVLKSASTLGGVPMAVPPSQRAPKALRPFFSDFLAIYCKQIEKDFYRCREEAERNKALIEQRRQDKAVRTKAVADELVALDEGLCHHIKRHRVALDEEHRHYADEFTERMKEACCHHEASLEATLSAVIAE